MSAPPLFRLVDERRVSVVRDSRDMAAVRQVLDDDPVGSCMVASRVAEHGIEPVRDRRRTVDAARAPSESLCYAGANLIPLRGGAGDLNAFADKAMSAARRCSSLVGRAELVLPMWQRLEHAWGPARDVREHQPLMALGTAPAVRRSTPRCGRCASTNSTPTSSRRSTCSSARSGIDPRIGDGGRGYRRRVAGLIAAGRAWARFERGQVVFKAEVGSQSPAVGQIQGVWVHPDWRGRGLGTAGTATLAAAVVRQRPHREPVRQQLQHRRPRDLRAHRLHRGRHVRDGAAGLTRPIRRTASGDSARSSPTRWCPRSNAGTRSSTPWWPPRTTTRRSRRSPICSTRRPTRPKRCCGCPSTA